MITTSTITKKTHTNQFYTKRKVDKYLQEIYGTLLDIKEQQQIKKNLHFSYNRKGIEYLHADRLCMNKKKRSIKMVKI